MTSLQLSSQRYILNRWSTAKKKNSSSPRAKYSYMADNLISHKRYWAEAKKRANWNKSVPLDNAAALMKMNSPPAKVCLFDCLALHTTDDGHKEYIRLLAEHHKRTTLLTSHAYKHKQTCKHTFAASLKHRHCPVEAVGFFLKQTFIFLNGIHRMYNIT